MKNIRPLLFIALWGLSLLAVSCGDKLNDTNHPNKGDLKVVTDWGTGVPATIPYIINYGLAESGEMRTVESNAITTNIKLVDPGIYTLEIYSKDFNTGFTLNGDVIEVDQDPENTDPDFIYSNPAVFFSARTSTYVRKDKANEIKVPLFPQMRKLVIRVYLANDPLIYSWQSPGGEFRSIDQSSIKGTLTGISNEFDFISDTYSGSKKVTLTFKEITMAKEKRRFLESAVTLVGFNEGDEQQFSLSFDFKEGLQIPPTNADFHDQLFDRGAERGDFNDYDKKRTNDTINMQIVLPLTASGSATITPYDPVINDDDIVVGEDAYKYTVGDAYPKNVAADKREGIVIWVQKDPGSDYGSHGVVLSGRQSDLKAWGPTADIYKLDKGNPVTDPTTGLRVFTATSKIGTKNIDGIRTYIKDNLYYKEQEFEAYACVKGSDKEFVGDYWFIPSVDEIKLLNNVPDLDDKLAAAGFQPINKDTLWTSQIEWKLEEEDKWILPGSPEYLPSKVFIRKPDGEITTTPVEKVNPDYVAPNPDAPVPPVDPNDPPVDPIPEYLPIKYNTRAFRFF